MRLRWLLAAAVFLAAGARAHAAPGAGGIALGQELYAVHCSSCHGLLLQGGDQAPPLIGVGANALFFELSTGRMPAERPFEQEHDQHPYFPRKQMRALIAYVLSRSGGTKKLAAFQVPPRGYGLRAGREVWEENCEQCHAATGRGDAATYYADVAPSLQDASPQLIATAVRLGPDVMPKFGPGVIDREHLGDLIAYVGYLQHAQYNPGGLQLANIGPVAEGFIVWTFGMGLLVLLIRRIGES